MLLEQVPRPRHGLFVQKSQGWMLQTSIAGGVREVHSVESTCWLLEPTHLTSLVRLPLPHGALHSPHGETFQEKDLQGAVLHDMLVACCSSGLQGDCPSGVSGDWQMAWRVALPPPQVALQGDHAV